MWWAFGEWKRRKQFIQRWCSELAQVIEWFVKAAVFFFLNSVPGRLELKGTTSQKLAQLQEREVELLEEREKQREVIQRLKEDRAHYREVADDLRWIRMLC